MVAATTHDIEMLEAISGQLDKIGVHMEIRLMELAEFTRFTRAGNHDQMAMGYVNGMANPIDIVLWMVATGYINNLSYNNDATHDELLQKFLGAADIDEAQKWARAADKNAIEKHWGIYVAAGVIYDMFQPYIKGFSGENAAGTEDWWWTLMWIDHDLKKAMGR